ncbi:MAG: hypothetical protein AAB545_01150 [Patescibacteria group bacterium]
MKLSLVKPSADAIRVLFLDDGEIPSKPPEIVSEMHRPFFSVGRRAKGSAHEILSCQFHQTRKILELAGESVHGLHTIEELVRAAVNCSYLPRGDRETLEVVLCLIQKSSNRNEVRFSLQGEVIGPSLSRVG